MGGCDHARLHDHVPVGRVDLDDAGHAREIEHHTAVRGDRSPAQTGSPTPRDDRDPLVIGEDEYARNLVFYSLAVVAVADSVFLARENVSCADDFTQSRLRQFAEPGGFHAFRIHQAAARWQQ